MSEDLLWYGTEDPRVLFHEKYDVCFNQIFDGGKGSIEQYGARTMNLVMLLKIWMLVNMIWFSMMTIEIDMECGIFMTK